MLRTGELFDQLTLRLPLEAYPSYWMRMSAPFASDADIEALTDVAGEALYVEL